MTEWEGIIEVSDEKVWNNIKLYSFRLEGVDRWFKTGKEQIEQVIGDNVKFTERNSKVDLTTIAVVEPSDAAPRPTAPAVSVSEVTADAAPKDIASRIQWQNARADATRVICAALQYDALPWPTNLAKGKRLDHLRGYINEMTKQFLEEETA